MVLLCGSSPTFSTSDIGGVAPLGLRRPLGPPVAGAPQLFFVCFFFSLTNFSCSPLACGALRPLASQHSNATWAGSWKSAVSQSSQVPGSAVSCVFCQHVGYSREDSCLAMRSSSGLKFLREVATARPLPTVLCDRTCNVVDTTSNLRLALVHAVLTLVPVANSLRLGEPRDEESSNLRNVLAASPRTPVRGTQQCGLIDQPDAVLW